jgi:putative alpha-1,2-mannosidase
VGTWLGDTVSSGSTSTSGVNSGGWLNFDTTGNAVVQVKVGISSSARPTRRPTSTASSRASTSPACGRTPTPRGTRCSTGSRPPAGPTSDLQKFYTALYHVLVNPNIESDVNGHYRGFDNAFHTASQSVSQNYSAGDIYRS